MNFTEIFKTNTQCKPPIVKYIDIFTIRKITEYIDFITKDNIKIDDHI